MKKITLFWSLDPMKGNPYYSRCPSFAMLTFSKILEENGYETTIVDSSILFSKKEFSQDPEQTLKKLIEYIEKTKPDFLAVGSWTFNMTIVAELTKLFRARNPDTPIILGGINPTFLPEETLKLLPHVNYLVRGEGEYTLLELIQNLSNSKSINDVKGISFWKDGKIVHTSSRPQIDDLDKLPLVDLEPYFKLKEVTKNSFDAFAFPITRGCIGKCSFCSMCALWPKLKFFSPRHIIEQSKLIYEKYGLRSIIEADNFLSNAVWAKKLASEIHKNFPDQKWSAQVRADIVSKELYKHLVENGLNRIYVGVESINAKILAFFNKTSNAKAYNEKFLKLLDTTKELNLDAIAVFIVGTPIETIPDLKELDNFIRAVKSKYNQLYVDISMLTMFPGTNLWNQYKQNKITLIRAPEEFKKNYIGKFVFEEKYSHIPWMIPGDYLIKNENIPLDDHLSLIKSFIDKLGYGEYVDKKVKKAT
jgi:radical SAM superfamily enzyme YgiQ (UPF0313 family)